MDFFLLQVSTSSGDTNLIMVVLSILALAILGSILYYVPIALWIAAILSGVRMGIFRLVGMRLRRVPTSIIVNAMIKAVKAELPKIHPNKLEAHYLASGNVDHVVDALISAKNAGIKLNFEQAAAIDLAGRDVLEAVQNSVKPKVIDSARVEAVCKDGIQLYVIARITVRAQIDKLVGGAGEDTIKARVGQGIVGAIGSADNYRVLMGDPSLISDRILTDGLSSGTAYEVLSIDIADIDVGESVGADLKTVEAEADLKVARAKAEEKRAEAQAEEQYFRARVQEMRAKLIEAEAQVPLAMAEAFRNGSLGIMDYHRITNVEADTRMRRAFSDMDDREAPEPQDFNEEDK